MDSPIVAAIDVLRASDLESSLLPAEAQAALETLFRAYMPMVRQIIQSLLASESDADDVTQTVFLGLPRALRRYQDGNFAAWLRRVAARTALMRLRAERRSMARWNRIMETATADDHGWHVALVEEDDAYLDDRDARIRTAFYALPSRLREVVFLRAIVEMTHGEIAEWLGISAAASYTRYCRGLQLIRREFVR